MGGGGVGVRTATDRVQNKITLRPLRYEDITEQYLRWWKDKRFTKYLETKKLNKKQAIEHIHFCNTNGCFLCAIDVDGVHVGNVKLNKERDLSIIIFPPYWGQGYATAAIQKMVEYAGGNITAGVRSGNIGSLKAFERAGFIETGRSQDVIRLACKHTAN
jgi:RimJ/RimL family protein N-acetyltransferase